MLTMKRWMAVVGVLLATAGCASRDGGLGQHREGQKATTSGGEAKVAYCPVMETEPIDPAVSVETNDGPVYFCCKGCIKKYQANPAKYAEGVAAQRRALADRP